MFLLGRALSKKEHYILKSVLFWIAHYHGNLFTNKCQNSNNERGKCNILMEVQKGKLCWGVVLRNISPKT